MKHGKNPTVAQCKIIANYKPAKGKALNPENWLVIKNLPHLLVIRHRTSLKVVQIPTTGKR